MRAFRYPNKIDRKGSDGKSLAVTHDIYALLEDASNDGVAFVVGSRLTHKVDNVRDMFPLGEANATKIGLPDKALYRIRKTVPVLISGGRITEMTKEMRGFVVGFDKKMSAFKEEFEQYLQQEANELSLDDQIIKLVPSLGICLKLNPGRGFGEFSEKLISEVFARPGTVNIPFEANGNTTYRPIDYDRGVKKLVEVLRVDGVNVEIVKI